MGPAEVAERKRKAKAKVHLGLMAKICLSQLERGARFLHESPLTAASRGEDCVELLMDKPATQRGVGHTC
eukprot:12689734-Alexandrium_andersonii.AAC.1